MIRKQIPARTIPTHSQTANAPTTRFGTRSKNTSDRGGCLSIGGTRSCTTCSMKTETENPAQVCLFCHIYLQKYERSTDCKCHYGVFQLVIVKLPPPLSGQLAFLHRTRSVQKVSDFFV